MIPSPLEGTGWGINPPKTPRAKGGGRSYHGRPFQAIRRPTITFLRLNEFRTQQPEGPVNPNHDSVRCELTTPNMMGARCGAHEPVDQGGRKKRRNGPFCLRHNNGPQIRQLLRLNSHSPQRLPGSKSLLQQSYLTV